ncbi:hypothetical protein HWV62_34555 [Athelia sp. TMB]|nr:hypothetical protein HWV62_34555 [Athelia sp. TMB]
MISVATFAGATSTMLANMATCKPVGSVVDPPFVLLISLMTLEPSKKFSSTNSCLLTALATKLAYKEVVESKDALGILWNRKPAAILITDPKIADSSNPHPTLIATLVKYARGGGRVIFGGAFSSHVTPDASDAFFKTVWGLKWKMALCASAQSRFVLNAHTPLRLPGSLDLPKMYSANAVLLEGVTAEDAVYAPADDGAALLVPVAYARFGDGYVGYHSAINAQDEASNILLSMLSGPACNLPKPAMASTQEELVARGIKPSSDD